jgi:Domain of unknown function (DUF4365)
MGSDILSALTESRQTPQDSSRGEAFSPLAGGRAVLTRNHQQEGLCRAYVQAVAALAGVGTTVPTPDYGIDLALRAIERFEQRHQDVGVQLDLQLRSTTRAHLFPGEVRYDIDVPTYESLRKTPPIPRILVLLVLPEEEDLWLCQSVEELVVRRCAYWTSLRGAEPVTATSSIRIVIPQSQVFSVQAVQTLMSRIAGGGLP